MPRRLLAALVATLALLIGPAAIAAASGRDVLDDCTADEVMSKTYTQKEYRDALAQLQGDTDQYGNCRDVIKRAQLQAAAAAGGQKKSGSSTGGGSGSGTAASQPPPPPGSGGGAGAIGSAPAAEQLSQATPTERQAVDEARTAKRSFQLDNAKVDPTKVGTVPGVSRVSDLPAPLVVVLALLLAAALAIGGRRIRSLVHSRRA
jgi:hypothetical protein